MQPEWSAGFGFDLLAGETWILASQFPLMWEAFWISIISTGNFVAGRTAQPLGKAKRIQTRR
jgi:hypothetical protein